jgi:hypothetical protein
LLDSCFVELTLKESLHREHVGHGCGIVFRGDLEPARSLILRRGSIALLWMTICAIVAKRATSVVYRCAPRVPPFPTGCSLWRTLAFGRVDVPAPPATHGRAKFA